MACLLRVLLRLLFASGVPSLLKVVVLFLNDVMADACQPRHGENRYTLFDILQYLK